jgi:hypothetical protein
MPDKTTLNRFPLVGLFADRAVRLLGYSTVLLKEHEK